MTNLKLRLMNVSIKGELLSSGRILKTWPLWKALHWLTLPLQWAFFDAEDRALYRELRFGILRRLIAMLEEMNRRETPGVMQHDADTRKFEPAFDEAKGSAAQEESP